MGRAKERGQKNALRDDAEYWIGNTNTNIARINICNGRISETIRFAIYIRFNIYRSTMTSTKGQYEIFMFDTYTG